VKAGTSGLNAALEEEEKMTIVCHYNPIMDEYVR
jgi:hypothetical protein